VPKLIGVKFVYDSFQLIVIAFIDVFVDEAINVIIVTFGADVSDYFFTHDDLY
jgi:hypothetical protein